MWDFPGSPVVKTPCFHCRGQGFHLIPGQGTKILHAKWHGHTHTHTQSWMSISFMHCTRCKGCKDGHKIHICCCERSWYSDPNTHGEVLSQWVWEGSRPVATVRGPVNTRGAEWGTREDFMRWWHPEHFCHQVSSSYIHIWSAGH